MFHIGLKNRSIHQEPFIGKEGPGENIIRIGLVVQDISHFPVYEK